MCICVCASVRLFVCLCFSVQVCITSHTYAMFYDHSPVTHFPAHTSRPPPLTASLDKITGRGGAACVVMCENPCYDPLAITCLSLVSREEGQTDYSLIYAWQGGAGRVGSGPDGNRLRSGMQWLMRAWFACDRKRNTNNYYI